MLREGTQQYLHGSHQVSCILIWLQVIAFWELPIALRGLVYFLNTTGPSLTQIVYAYFDRSSFIEYLYIIYIYIYIIMAGWCFQPL